MKRPIGCCGAVLLGVFASTGAAAAAVTLGQVDTFEDGTTQGWGVPGFTPNPPTNVATGGPAGAGDAYLRLTASGLSGPGSRLSVLNSAQWAGDYSAAGVTAITMSVNNAGPEDVFLRFLLGNFSTHIAVTEAAFVPAGSGWVSVTISLEEGTLTVQQGTAAGALAATTDLRLFHNPDPNHPGPGAGPPTVSATVGVDNIRAVPAPAASTLLAVGGLALTGRHRRG